MLREDWYQSKGTGQERKKKKETNGKENETWRAKWSRYSYGMAERAIGIKEKGEWVEGNDKTGRNEYVRKWELYEICLKIAKQRKIGKCIVQ